MGTPQKSTSWTIRQQKQSNRTLPHSNVTSSSLNLAITASTPLNKQSKHSKINSLAPLDMDFPIQLWDKLAPQVQDSIILL
jgi:hypothetical protein